MHFAYTTILNAPRFGWQPAPSPAERVQLYRLVREIGFEAIEWSPRWLDFHDVDDGELAMLKQEAADEGLCVSALNLNRSMVTRCSEASEHRERFRRSVEVAPLLGAGIVIISLSMPQPPSADRPGLIGQTVPSSDREEAADVLKEVARRAAGTGVQLVLELHDDGLLDTPELCLHMLDRINEPNVSINPDLGNLVRNVEARCQWREALAQLAPHAGYWHVKNYRSGQPAPIWDGDIDYAEAVVLMRAASYDGWVSIESYTGDDVFSLQRDSLRWLQEQEATAAV